MIIRFFSISFFALLLLSGYRITDFSSTDALSVIVKPVDYDQHNWEYWGFANDWLQEEVVNKLNKDKDKDYEKKNIHFFTEEEATAKNIKAYRAIELIFIDIKMGPQKKRRFSHRRTRRIMSGYTNTTPSKPIHSTVSASVYYDENYTDNSATLQYRIYDPASDKDILLDHFTNKYSWSNITAFYNGNESAVSWNDWKYINNVYRDVPADNTIVLELVRDCHKTLINKIKNKVKF